MRSPTSFNGKLPVVANFLSTVTPAPFRPKIAHHDYDAVSNLKETVVKLLKLPSFQTAVVTHLSCRLNRGRNSPEGPLEVSDGHADFLGFVIA